MANIDIWMPWYTGDYLNKTRHLQTPQHGAYLLLLAHQWAHGGKALPNDLDALIQVTGMRPFFVDASSITKASVSQSLSISGSSTSPDLRLLRAWMLDLLKEFFVQQPDGGWLNLRGAREYAKWAERQDNFRKRGKAGAKGRWGDGYIPQRKRTGQNGDATSIAQTKLKQSPLPSPSKNKSKYQRNFVPGSDRSAGSKSAPPSSSSTPGKKPARSTSPPTPKSPTPKKGSQRPVERSGLARGAGKPAKASNPAKKNVATGVKKPSTPQKPSGGVDSRFGSFREEIFKYWRSIHKKEIAAGLMPADPPWGPRERVEMNTFLKSNAALTLPMFVRLLINRAGSEVVHAHPPYKWIKDLMMYSRGRLDRFKQPS